MKNRTKTLIFTLINLFLAISSVIVTYITITEGTVAGQVDTGGSYGLFYLATFTMDSNILLGVIALIAAIFSFKNLKKSPDSPLPHALTIAYLVAASSAVLTFLTVVLFLAPVRAASGRNYFDMLLGPMFFFHFFNPVLAAVNLIFFTPDNQKITLKQKLFALIPPAIYAVPYVTGVAILGIWPDFYGLTFGGHGWLLLPAFVVFALLIFTIASIIASLHNRLNKTN